MGGGTGHRGQIRDQCGAVKRFKNTATYRRSAENPTSSLKARSILSLHTFPDIKARWWSARLGFDIFLSQQKVLEVAFFVRLIIVR